MKLTTIIEAKHKFIDCVPVTTFAHVEGRLKKKGKMSLRMRQMDKTAFIQGEIIDLRDERKVNRKNEKKAKKRFY